MRISKSHTLFGKRIDVRCADLAALGVIARDVAVAKIVCVDDDDVRLKW